MKFSDIGSRKKSTFASTLVVAGALFASGSANVVAAEVDLRVSGIVSTHKYHTELEREFYESLAEDTGIDVAVNFNPVDVLGINMQDVLRLTGGGTFDVMEATAGVASRDDPFLGGVDLIGVSPDMETLKDVVEAYREVFNKRLKEKFNVRAMTLWPFGPQVFYCKPEITGLKDFEGLKVRSYTPSMSALIEDLGGIPVTFQFEEVYVALQRGVTDCSITSPTSGNTGKWPEVTNYYFPLAISWSVNAHFMSLATWDKLSPEEQEKLDAAFRGFEEDLWELARNRTQDANSCNIGGPCEDYNQFDMTLVEPTAEDKELLKKATTNAVLPTWVESCERMKPDCVQVWNETAGEAADIKIAE